jgi:hypothetical protein
MHIIFSNLKILDIQYSVLTLTNILVALHEF